MELRADTDMKYSQILHMIRQLPKNDIKKLANTLQYEIKRDKPIAILQDLIAQAPTWSESDFESFQVARNHINESRLS